MKGKNVLKENNTNHREQMLHNLTYAYNGQM